MDDRGAANQRPHPGMDSQEDFPDASINDAATMRAEAQRKRFRVGNVLLDRYRITGELGQGGMGVVFRCFDEIGGIDVAVKALPPELSHNTLEMEEVRENFRTIHGLHHPHIAATTGLERDPATGEYYLVMEYAEGVNLRHWRRGYGDGPVLADVLPILRQVADALDFAHSRRIVHRDIKPANLMVAPDGTVKVLDFGLAAQIHTSLTRVSQAYHGTSGTAPYMAPEQWRGRSQGPGTDQYALATTAYELLAGHPPFDSHDPAVLREIVLNESPEPVRGMDPKAWQVLARALDKEPENRYSSCTEFVAALEGGAKTENRKAPRSGGSGGRQWVWAAVILLLAGLGLGSFWLLQPRESHQFVQPDDETERLAQLPEATRERLAALLKESEDACGRSAFAEALEANREALQIDGKNRRALAQRERIKGMVGIEHAAPAKSTAEVEAAQIGALDAADGFGEQVKRLRIDLGTADALFGKEQYGSALALYVDTAAGCRALLTMDKSRTTAQAARGEAEAARERARQVQAETDAADLWKQAEAALADAGAEYRKGAPGKLVADGADPFAKAAAAWRLAAGTYAKAIGYADGARNLRKARESYASLWTSRPWRGRVQTPDIRSADQAALTKLLEQYGGSDWRTVGQALDAAAELEREGKWTEAAAKVAEATKALPEAVAAADRSLQSNSYAAALAAGRAALDKQAWAEAERQFGLALAVPGQAADREALAGRQAARVGAALAEARTARDAGRWSEAIAAADRVLALDPRHREAKEVKAVAEGRLVPTWRLVATVGGKEVPATVTVSGESFQAPHSFTLEEGNPYTADFTYEIGGKRYRADSVAVRADWKGEREQRVALEEIRGPLEGQNAKLEGIGLELVWIASGKFRMGSDSGERDERPVHDVQISHGFWMGRCEVTNGEYQVFLKATGYDGKWDTDGDYLKHHGDGSSMSTAADYPVCWVSWRNAMAFCVWLTERERAAGRLPKGYKYRLPTEAEWEYAARGGSRSRNYTYAGSNSVDEVAWYSSNAGSATHPVGKKKSNEIGFCDMSGNVWELCLDWFDTEYYKRSPGTDPTNSKSGDGRVVRGGGWNAAADGVRTTGRRWVGLGKTDGDLGFRICLGP